jgi:hypothetical protein
LNTPKPSPVSFEKDNGSVKYCRDDESEHEPSKAFLPLCGYADDDDHASSSQFFLRLLGSAAFFSGDLQQVRRILLFCRVKK